LDFERLEEMMSCSRGEIEGEDVDRREEGVPIGVEFIVVIIS
jgi:hypothetical protein